MADQNPTGHGVAVTLNIPADHVNFLRSTFEKARDGIRDELEEFPDQLDPKRLHREHAVYGRLLTAMDELIIVPDADTSLVLADLAKVIDTGNEFSRVVAEHKALRDLLVQLGGGTGR